MSECAERVVREYPAGGCRKWSGDSGGVGGSQFGQYWRECPVRPHRPAGRDSPVIPGLVGNHPGDCRSGTAPIRKEASETVEECA